MDKDSQRSTAQQTAAEAFVEWFNSQWSDDPGEAERTSERTEGELYFRDAGEAANMPEPTKPARDSFADWFGPDIFVAAE